MKHVVVREHARLTTHSIEPSIDEASVSTVAFEWLCAESARLRRSGAPLVQLEGRHWLRLDNYVGVLRSPCGTCIEVLPKALDPVDPARTRRMLRQMLTACLSITPRQSAVADIAAFAWPLTEWVAAQFLNELDKLVKRGMRFEYRAQREELRFLRGRLDVVQQLRQPPGRSHLFRVEHDVFAADRPENRLIRSALDVVRGTVRTPDNWRLAHELASLLSIIPPSTSVQSDFRCWRSDRLNAHYAPIRPWCSLILNEQSPLTTLGSWNGNSLLFPMERVYQQYLGHSLETSISPIARLKRTPRAQHLCRHREQDWFRLEPDFLVSEGDRHWIVDAKWKLLDASASSGSDKYGLSEGDFYQMCAYARRYLGGRGDLYLVYPRTKSFAKPLDVFTVDGDLRIWVAPFDLETRVLHISGGELPVSSVRAVS